MKYVKSVEAALRATAPFVAIPVEGHAPACVRGKLLKGALKGVTVTSVKIITGEKSPNCEAGRWLEIKGRAEGGVRTSCKIVAENVKNYKVWKQLRAWTDKEREKRVKVINQGVLNPAERKALKLKEAMAKEEKARNAELIAAKREEADILYAARSHVFPPITPVEPERRESILAEYTAFHVSRPNRKRGSVIRWQLKKLREQVVAMTVERREYKAQESQSPMRHWHKPRRKCVGVTRVLRRQKDKLEYISLTYQIGKLETEFKALYPAVWIKREEWEHGGYWEASFVEKRPKSQTYFVPWHWGRPEHVDNLDTLATRLREVRINIRALTPPSDEDEGELPIAA